MRKLKKAWRTPIFYASSVGSRHGWRSLSTSTKKQFISLVAGFAFFQENIFRNTFRWLLLKRKNDIFNNHNVCDSKRCLHGSKNPCEIDLKRYLMNRSIHLLLNFLFWFAKIALIREGIVVLLKKRAAGYFRNLYK